MALWTEWSGSENTCTENPAVRAFALEHGILSWASAIAGFPQDRITHIELCIDNPNATIIVIKAMCMGIIFTDHTLHKMEYFRSIVKDRFQMCDGYRGKYYVVGTDWDTSRWSMGKLKNIHFWISHIDNLSMDHIKQTTPLIPCERPDIAFLEAMSWNPIGAEERTLPQKDK